VFEHKGQAQPAERIRLTREAGDPRDPVAVDGEDHDAVGLVVAGLLVRRERRLSVGSCRHQADAIEAASSRTVAKKAPIAPAPSKRIASGGIVSRWSSASSATMPSMSTALHASWKRSITRASTPAAAGRCARAKQPLLVLACDSLAGALQGAVDRRDAVAQQLRDLAGRPDHEVDHDRRTIAVDSVAQALATGERHLQRSPSGSIALAKPIAEISSLLASATKANTSSGAAEIWMDVCCDRRRSAA
jgi:hypothetical protein